jgi:septal ring factor EnvC (AmiA/AmiB activator)
MIRLAAILCALALPVGADTPAETAIAAINRLEAAAAMLDNAEGSRDRVAALTETVHAYEDGLSALRDGMRQAAAREQAISRDLAERRQEISQLLGVLQTIGRAPTPLLLLHPTGPTGAARSGMMLSEVTPALQARAETLRNDLEEVTVLRELQANALGTLEAGLNGVQTARTTLTQAVSQRTDLPRKYTQDPIQIGLLIASTETLEGFASGLSDITEGVTAPDTQVTPGGLPSPVTGLILRHAGEADAAGIVRPGALIATRPRAMVTSPVAATVRYVGPLLDYGNVVILEPQQNHLLILAGLADVYGSVGEVLPEGAPVGLMGGQDGQVDAILTEADQATGTFRSETLYIELRNGQGPIDPATWFALDEE